MINVIATGSTGNAVLYHNSILVDCGVSFKAVEPYLFDLQIVLLTHKHLDHINISTLEKMQFNRPILRFGMCDWMLQIARHLKNIDVYEVGKWYDYGVFKISPIQLQHDVPNCGFRIFKGEHKTLHATDTATMQGIEAKDYSLYALESNYDEDTIDESIARIEANGGFAYQKGAKNTHLSWQQHKDFIFENAAKDSKVIRLHESQTK